MESTKEAFDLGDVPTPADTRAAFSNYLVDMAESMLLGQDGAPQDQCLVSAVITLEYEKGSRVVTVCQDKFEALHAAYHALGRSIFQELQRKHEAGEDVTVCGTVAALFTAHAEAAGGEAVFQEVPEEGGEGDAAPTVH